MKSLITVLLLGLFISSEAQNISQSQVRQFNAVPAYRVFGRGNGVGTPSFITLDSNHVPQLHSQNYYDLRYLPLLLGKVDSVKMVSDSLKYYKSTTATLVSRVALYNFSNLKNGDYLKYDSLNNQWVNFKSPQRYDTIQTFPASSLPTGNIGVGSDNRLYYISGGYKYRIGPLDSILAISEIPVSFPTQSPANLSNSGGLWTTTSPTAAYGNLGLSGVKLASGQNGYLIFDWTSGEGNAVFGFSSTNAVTGYTSMKAAAYISPTTGEVLRDDNGASAYLSGTGVGGHYVLANGDKVKINRTGSSLTMQKSSDGGASFTTLYTYTFSSSADLFVTLDIYGGGTGKIRNPKSFNLQ